MQHLRNVPLRPGGSDSGQLWRRTLRIARRRHRSAAGANAPPAPLHAIQRLIVGDHLLAERAAGRRNLDEDRISTVHAVFARR